MSSIDASRPAYRILSSTGFYGPDDHLYGEGAEIYFDGEPNEEMEPLNELGRLKLVQFIDKLEREARTAAEKLGKTFNGRPKSHDGGYQLATELQRAGVAIMQARKVDQGIDKIEEEVVPETSIRRGRGRPPGAKTKAKFNIGDVA